MLLDRLLDRAGLELSPFGVIDVRRGVRVEFSASTDAHVYCVLRGEGALRAEQGFAASVAASTIAIVPPGIAHVFEPDGGSTRVISLRSVSTSARVPTVIAGDGAVTAGLLVMCARVRALDGSQSPLEPFLAPMVVDLNEVARARAAFAALLVEQEDPAPGRRRMTELLLYQCLIHLLRERPSLWTPSSADANHTRTTAVGLKAPRSAP